MLPVSVFILSNLDLYGAVLNDFSKPLMARTDLTPQPQARFVRAVNEAFGASSQAGG